MMMLMMMMVMMLMFGAENDDAGNENDDVGNDDDDDDDDDDGDLSQNEDCVDLVLTRLEGIIPLFFFKGVLAFFDFPFASTVALLDLLCCSENSLKSGLFIL